MQFFYIDITDYPVTQEGIFQACYDEVVAEAQDTGHFPMYGAKMVTKSEQYKYDEFMNQIQRMIGV